MESSDPRLKQYRAYDGPLRPRVKKPIEKSRKCLRCDKSFRPKSRFYFVCNECHESFERANEYE